MKKNNKIIKSCTCIIVFLKILLILYNTEDDSMSIEKFMLILIVLI